MESRSGSRLFNSSPLMHWNYRFQRAQRMERKKKINNASEFPSEFSFIRIPVNIDGDIAKHRRWHNNKSRSINIYASCICMFFFFFLHPQNFHLFCGMLEGNARMEFPFAPFNSISDVASGRGFLTASNRIAFDLISISKRPEISISFCPQAFIECVLS